MNGEPEPAQETREFEFVLQFESGADELMDVFRQYESLSLWSSAIFVNDSYMWRLDYAKGTSEALDAFDEVFLNETRCNECFDVVDCDTDRSYCVLDRQETSRTIYTLRQEIDSCHSLPHIVLDHIQTGTIFESRRVGDEYRWRILFPGDSPIGDIYDTLEAQLREGVSLSVSHITTGSDWKATERLATDFSPEHWEVLKAAVKHGYYERPRQVSVSDLASILDEPRSTVQYRLRTAEDRIVSEFVERTL